MQKYYLVNLIEMYKVDEEEYKLASKYEFFA